MGTGRHFVVFDSSCERFDSRNEFYQAIDSQLFIKNET